MKGWGCDNEEIANVLGNRSSGQRNEIEKAYKSLFGKDLSNDLKDELGGNFERLVMAMMLPWPHLCAKQIKKAFKGIGTDEETLIDLLCTANNCQIKEIVSAYKESTLFSATFSYSLLLLAKLLNPNLSVTTAYFLSAFQINFAASQH